MKKIKVIIIYLIVFILIMSMTIVFASFSETMSISGEAKVMPYAKIRIKKVVFDNSTGSGYETYNADFNINKATMYSSLPNNGDSVTYKIVFQNDYSDDYYISNVEVISNNNESINVTYNNCETNLLLKANSETTGYITFNESNNNSSQDIIYSIKYTFKKKEYVLLANYVMNLAKLGNTNSLEEIGNTGLAYDGTSDNNLRYIGSNPNNYITFNNQTWRIIGVFNNIDDGTGNKETRVKIISTSRINYLAWDMNSSGTALYTNDWTTSNVKTILNDYYLNSSTGTGYYYQNSTRKSHSFDFSDNGLNNVKDYIGNTVWGITGPSERAVTTSDFYNQERNGTVIPSNSNNSSPSKSWTGKIGLLYPSDYGFATSGGNTTNRSACLNYYISNSTSASKNTDWRGYSDCYENDYLYHSDYYNWSMTPYAIDDTRVFLFYIAANTGFLVPAQTYSGYGVYPTLYLKSNVLYLGGSGSNSDPYKIGLK